MAAKFEVGINWDQPPIHLVMGSDSDRLIVAETAELLEDFGVPYYPDIDSAHRSPKELEEYCAEIAVRDEELVLVAYAGMAAALSGDMAARIPQTVIGVPLINPKDTMNASIAAQLMMPPGSGLVIVGPDQSINAGLAALRTLGTSHREVREQITAYQESNRQKLLTKRAELRGMGLEAFADQKRPKPTVSEAPSLPAGPQI